MSERVHESTCSWLVFGPCDGDNCYSVSPDRAAQIRAALPPDDVPDEKEGE